MPTQTELFQLALDVAGSRRNIASPTEASREAELCRRWYNTVRNQVLRAAFWPATKASRRLSVQAEKSNGDWITGDPDPSYQFAYAAPSDMLRPRFLSDFSRFELSVWAGDQISIMSNTDEALLIYSFRQTNINVWDEDLYQCIVYALAANITRPLTGKDQTAYDNLSFANQIIMNARANDANINEASFDTLPEWLSARGYCDSSISQFIYPFGPSLSLTRVNS